MDKTKYISYVAGRPVAVEITLTEAGSRWDILHDVVLSDVDRIMIAEEAEQKCVAFAKSKLLLG